MNGGQEQHSFPTPSDLSVIYHTLAREVTRMRIPTQDSPFPPDLMRQLTDTFESTRTEDGSVERHEAERHNTAAGGAVISQ